MLDAHILLIENVEGIPGKVTSSIETLSASEHGIIDNDGLVLSNSDAAALLDLDVASDGDDTSTNDHLREKGGMMDTPREEVEEGEDKRRYNISGELLARLEENFSALTGSDDELLGHRLSNT